MKTIICGLVMLLFVGFAQAQLVPNGLVLYKGDASSETQVVSPQDSSAEDSGVSLNWSADSEGFADSVAIYQRDYVYNINKRDGFLRAALISNWSGLGAALAGLGLLSAGLTGHGDVYTYAGSAILAAGLVGFGLSIGFDIVSNTYSVRAGFFNQKKIDYQRRHSVLLSGDH